MPTNDGDLWVSARIDFRAPKKHKKMLQDIARNRGVKDSVVYREMAEQYLSRFSTIPSLKELSRQVDKHEKKLVEIERTLLKKGIME